MIAPWLFAPLPFLLAAAPGEAPVRAEQVPDVARAAVARRFDPESELRFQALAVKPSRNLPGYAVCGQVASPGGAYERFFVVVPGSFAVLDRDDKALVGKYWKLNGC